MRACRSLWLAPLWPRRRWAQAAPAACRARPFRHLVDRGRRRLLRPRAAARQQPASRAREALARCALARRLRRPDRPDRRLGRPGRTCCRTCTPTRRCATRPRRASCAGRTSRPPSARTRPCSRPRASARARRDRRAVRQDAARGVRGRRCQPAAGRAPRAPRRSTTASPRWARSSTGTSATPTCCWRSPRRAGGVPEALWRKAKRDDAGRVLLGIDAPTYVPVIQNAGDAHDARAHVARQDERGRRRQPEAAGRDRPAAPASTRRCSAAASYADFTLRRRMAESTREAAALPRRRARRVTERERQRARRAARRQGAPPAASRRRRPRSQRWDVGYYSERVRRERYSVDQEAFRPYFPPQESLAFVMRMAEQMLGVRYVRVPTASSGTPTCRPTRCTTRAPASRWPRCTSTSTRATASTTTPRSGSFRNGSPR